MYVCMWGPVRRVRGHMGRMQTSQHVCMPRSAFLEEATELLASNPFVPSQPTKTIHIHYRALERIHTYIHTYIRSSYYLISGPEGMGWNGMHTRKQSGSTFTAAGWLNTGKLSGTMALRRGRSIHDGFPQAIWACAVHAIHTYTCESSCMSETMSVTLPSTVDTLVERNITITHLSSSYLTIYQLAYKHSGIPTAVPSSIYLLSSLSPPSISSSQWGARL